MLKHVRCGGPVRRLFRKNIGKQKLYKICLWNLSIQIYDSGGLILIVAIVCDSAVVGRKRVAYRVYRDAAIVISCKLA